MDKSGLEIILDGLILTTSMSEHKLVTRPLLMIGILFGVAKLVRVRMITIPNQRFRSPRMLLRRRFKQWILGLHYHAVFQT